MNFSRTGLDHLSVPRHHLQRLGDVLTQLGESAAAWAGGGAGIRTRSRGRCAGKGARTGGAAYRAIPACGPRRLRSRPPLLPRSRSPPAPRATTRAGRAACCGHRGVDLVATGDRRHRCARLLRLPNDAASPRPTTTAGEGLRLWPGTASLFECNINIDISYKLEP